MGTDVDVDVHRAVLAAVAVLEPHATVGRVASLTGLTEPTTRTAVSELVRGHRLAADEPLRFRDEQDRESTYDDLAAPVRASLHAAAADLLRDQHHAGVDFVRHVQRAEPAGRQDRVQVLREAAAVEYSAGRAGNAIALLQRALAEPAGQHRADILLELGRVELELAADPALAHLDEALALIDDGPRRIDVLTELSQAMALRGRASQALDRLLQEQRSITDDALRLRMDIIIVAAAGLLPERVSLVHERLEAFADLPGNNASERSALALACLNARTAQDAADLARRALHDGAFAAEEGPASMWLHRTVVTLARAGAVAEAAQAVGQFIDVPAQKDGQSSLTSAMTHWTRSSVRMLHGDVAGARADAQVALHGAVRGGWTLGVVMSAAALIDASLAAGDVDTAGQASAAAPERLGNEVVDAWLRFARARLLIARGKLRDAAADLDELAALDPGPLTAWSLPLWPERVRVRVALGQHDDADEIARDGLERARAWANPETVSRALRAVAATASDSARTEALGEAWDLTASAVCPVERAQVGADLGAALRRVGRRADAANVLREALELADDCGALAYVDTIRRELAALGARPRRSRRSGAGSLTPREYEIAELAAAGVMNDEIARALHVTVKTVETHLTRTYRKLGVTGRAELGAALS